MSFLIWTLIKRFINKNCLFLEFQILICLVLMMWKVMLVSRIISNYIILIHFPEDIQMFNQLNLYYVTRSSKDHWRIWLWHPFTWKNDGSPVCSIFHVGGKGKTFECYKPWIQSDRSGEACWLSTNCKLYGLFWWFVNSQDQFFLSSKQENIWLQYTLTLEVQ